MIVFWLIVILILFALASPVAIREKSGPRLIAAMALSFVVVVLPLFFFFASSLMLTAPDWKGACQHGWLDCFSVGKLALSPFVLLATAALYKIDVLRMGNPKARWTVVGIFLGAMVATACLVFGLVCIGFDAMMTVPFYVAVWYDIRTIQLVRRAGLGFWTYFVAVLGTVPFWLSSWLWSSNVYQSLPDKPPGDCFVVTAAGRGHRRFVGPFFEIKRGGHRRQANQQLITLWEFESLWSGRFPRSHRLFRRGYNWIGPRVASRIRSPWLADATFIALKPVELIARRINQVNK